MIVKVKIITPLDGVFTKYQPEVGEIYDASYSPPRWVHGKDYTSPVCIINVKDKKVCLRRSEYEIVGD